MLCNGCAVLCNGCAVLCCAVLCCAGLGWAGLGCAVLCNRHGLARSSTIQPQNDSVYTMLELGNLLLEHEVVPAAEQSTQYVRVSVVLWVYPKIPVVRVFPTKVSEAHTTLPQHSTAQPRVHH